MCCSLLLHALLSHATTFGQSCQIAASLDVFSNPFLTRKGWLISSVPPPRTKGSLTGLSRAPKQNTLHARAAQVSPLYVVARARVHRCFGGRRRGGQNL